MADVTEVAGPDSARPGAAAGTTGSNGPVDRPRRPGTAEPAEPEPVVTIATVVAAGAALAITGHAGVVALLAAVAVTQAAVALTWLVGMEVPGRKGALVIAALAAVGADVCISVWPGGRLGTLLAVFGLAVPVMFVHQLARAAARVRVVESLSGVAFAVLAVVSPAAFVQLRREFTSSGSGGRVVAGIVIVAAAALIVGLLVDLVMPAPRFDPSVGRGLLAVIASAGLGGSIGHLLLGTDAGFLNGRGAFVGAAIGALAALLAIATAFARASAPEPESAVARMARPLVTALVPLALVAPVAFLLCSAVRA